MIENKLNNTILLFTTISSLLIFNVASKAQIIFPNAVIKIIYFELADSNKNIIPATPIAGENGILAKLIYPEIAKRAGLEGIVHIEFEVDENGVTKNILILKDIGGQCGEEAVKSLALTKFIPAKLNKKNIETKYRIAFKFQMVPINQNK